MVEIWKHDDFLKNINTNKIIEVNENNFDKIIEDKLSNVTLTVDKPFTLKLKKIISVSDLNNVFFDFQGKVEIIDWGIEFKNCKNLIFDGVIVRMGDSAVLKTNKGKRPKNSIGLDCFNLDFCENILIKNSSLSFGCDELLSVTHCKNVHVINTLFSFPLGGNPLTHPYGENHAECINSSANESLCISACTFAYYRMRGPQFEANDTIKDKFSVNMQVSNSLMHAFSTSACRMYGNEKDNEFKNNSYKFQFLSNVQSNVNEIDSNNLILCDLQYGTDKDKVRVFLDSNYNFRFSKKKFNKTLTNLGYNGKPKEDILSKKKLFTFECCEPYSGEINYEYILSIINNSGTSDNFDQKIRNCIINDLQKNKDLVCTFQSKKDAINYIDKNQ